ncbi:MAG: type IV secretory system conjugative DNA transfer family protein [Varibaculum cambriense]
MNKSTTGARGTSTFWHEWGLIVAICGGFALAVLAWAGYELGGVFSGSRMGGFLPVQLVLETLLGKRAGTSMQIGCTAALFAVTFILIVGFLFWRKARRGKREMVDDMARVMAPRGVGRASLANTRKSSKALGVSAPGMLIGRAVDGAGGVYAGFEDVMIDIWGPRRGKTTARAVPLICDAPGVVVATSNKRDLVDITRRYRARRDKVWVFDPQGIVGENPTWYWDPLTFVTDAVKAKELAEIFASATRSADARVDPHFDPAGQDLLAGLFLAAARGGFPISQVWSWLQNPNDLSPVSRLKESEYSGDAAMGELIAGMYAVNPKQRDGYVQTARGFCTVMLNSSAMAWVTPRVGARRFDVAEFVSTWHKDGEVNRQGGKENKQSLFMISKEGEGTAGPLVTALTVAVAQAAEREAERQARGRLAVPMMLVLDEAANVCKWSRLPDMYSHYGSRGIIVDTILQSYSQGEAVWGKEGMRKLWSAATIKVYGGGVSETEFLKAVSDLVGEYWTTHVSTSYGKGTGVSTSRQVSREQILPVADLAALPSGRAVVMGAGMRPVLINPVPYWRRGYVPALPGLEEMKTIHLLSADQVEDWVEPVNPDLTDTQVFAVDTQQFEER